MQRSTASSVRSASAGCHHVIVRAARSAHRIESERLGDIVFGVTRLRTARMLHLKQLARVGTRMDRKVARRTRSVHDIAFLTSIGHRGASIAGAMHAKMAPQRWRKDADNIVTPCSCMKQGTTRERARAESRSDSVHAGFAGLVLLACRC